MVRPLIQVGDAVHRATMKIQHDATQELGQLDLNKRRFPPALWFFPIQSDIDRIQGTEWKYVKIDSDTLDKQTTTEKTSTNSKIDSREKQIALGQATYLISDALEDIYNADSSKG